MGSLNEHQQYFTGGLGGYLMLFDIVGCWLLVVVVVGVVVAAVSMFIMIIPPLQSPAIHSQLPAALSVSVVSVQVLNRSNGSGRKR